MNIEVTKDSVIILENSDTPHENEYKITECHFNFDDFTNSFQVKRAIFTILSTDEMYETDIINNKCDIPAEVLKHEYEIVKLGVYGFNIDENDDLANRFSPSYAEFTVPTGSYEEGALSPEIITPTQYDLYSQALQEGLEEVNDKLDELVDTVDGKIEEIDEAIQRTENIDIDAEKTGKITSITITRQDGTTKEVTLEDGMGLDYKWLGTSLGIKREDEQEYVYVDLRGPKGDSGSIKFIIVETLPSENIDESAIYLTPSENPDLKNHYDEWIWVTDRFEPLGETQIEVDLTDYVKNTDYATNVKGGVLKTGNGTYLDGNGIIVPSEYSMSSYNDRGRNTFISKGTLENVITGKGLVSNTDYATNSTGGVVKIDAYAITKNTNGNLMSNIYNYSTYSTASDNSFISKGTLENVITGKGLVSNTDYATGSVGGVIKTPSTLGISVGSTGNVFALTSTYEQYGDRPPGYFIGKATLDNVLDAKIGDIQTLLDNLNNGNGVE